MGIFINDEDDIESGIEHALSNETHEASSLIEERLRVFAENNERLEKAIAENDIEAIENLKLQVLAYKEELGTVREEILEINFIIEKEQDSHVSSAVLLNEKMRLERWSEKVEGYVARYDAYLTGSKAPETVDGVHIVNLIELWHERVQGNIHTLENAIQNNDEHAVEILGHSLEGYKTQEADFEKAVSDISNRLKDEYLSDSVRAILSSDQIYLLDLLDDIRYYITEYTRVLAVQMKNELEPI